MVGFIAEIFTLLFYNKIGRALFGDSFLNENCPTRKKVTAGILSIIISCLIVVTLLIVVAYALRLNDAV